VGYLTSLGWMIALPIAGGILAGRFLDQRLGSGGFWTLALLAAGIGIAAMEMYLVVQAALRRTRRA
jgi:Putative F0F1-ATPase subunit Ca2+/Mg2+ transporter